ncbi:MAG: MFS transporter [Bacteroidales bacterium]|nr:MFS transporter [Candidatus Cryptobacteroides aphodequi]
MGFLSQPKYLPEQSGPAADRKYRSLRLQVFIGAFIAYAGFYLVRKNFSMAIPFLTQFGFEKGELGIVLSMNAFAYAFSRLIMGPVSDRSDARKFLPLGLICAAVAMCFMIVPIAYIHNHTLSIVVMCVLNALVGWFNGMGYPPCTRIITHWFSQTERGTMSSIWNCSHNIGGALVGPMAVYGAMWFGNWFYGQAADNYFLIGTFAFPAAVAVLVAVLAWCLVRDTPQSQGLCCVEKYKNDWPANYSAKSEETLSVREILGKYIFPNKLLWCVCLADAFIFMVRYGCLDWAPTYLTEAHGFDIKNAGWAYFAYEFAAIPGTLLCGWLSDKLFKGRRALLNIIYTVCAAICVLLYWKLGTTPGTAIAFLICIGFFIYGPIMLLAVQAMDLVPKNAAGAAVGLIGFCTYLLGTAVLANTVLGFIVQRFGWGVNFVVVLLGCLAAIFFMALTVKSERRAR